MSHEPARPVQLRRDLEHSLQQQQGKTYLVVKDPVTRRYFRFTEAQASIMDLFMDVPQDVAVIAERASEKLNKTISPATIEAFCKSLEEKFLLETPEVREKIGAIRGQQLEGRNFLYWKIASFDPERIFAWLLPRTAWAFRPGFQLLALLTIFIGFTITWLNWSSLSGAAPGLLSIYGFLLILPVVFTVTTIHEFSHGLTCCHYGGKVHEVGFMLIYFNPAFYCDVSDSYMFPKRTNRMAVALAGGFVQLTVWGICTIVWRLTDSNASINQLALIVVVFSGLQTLVNFNPLIKLDGYYMLSDFLEVPNLRAKALRSLWDWIAGNGKSGWSYREKRAQLVYGAASAVFSISLLVYVYTALYTWATSKYALAGLVLFGIFANFTLRKALVEPVEGVKAVATRASLKRYRNGAIALAVLILTFFVPWELKIPAKFKIVPLDERSVNARTEGYVVKILVQEDSKVHKGDTLAIMAEFEKGEKSLDYLGQLNEKRSELAGLRKGTRTELIEEQEAQIARIEVEQANAHRYQEQQAVLEATLSQNKAALDGAQKVLTRYQDPRAIDVIARIEVEKAETAVNVAKEAVRITDAQIRELREKADNDYARISSQLVEAQKRLKTLQAGNLPELIQQVEAEVMKLESLYEQVTHELKKTDIIAGIDGIVITEHVEQKVNTHLDPGQELMRVADVSSVKVEMMVSQKDLEDVIVGNVVRLKLESYSTIFEGKVDYVAKVAHPVDGQQVVTVRATLKNEQGLLKPYLTGNAKIYCGKRLIIDLMTRRIRKSIRNEFFDLGP